MFALLDPRVWLACVLAITLAFGAGYFKGNTNGRKASELAHAAAVAVAEADSRRLERARQSRADQAASIAAGREAGNRRAADGARDATERLRDAIAARDLAEDSIASANQRAAARGKLLIEGAEAYRQLAATCDRHVNDVRLLLESWPTDSP
jgi:hypothetical protein